MIKNRRKVIGLIILTLCSLSAIITSLLLVLIVGTIAIEALPAINPQLLTGIDVIGPDRGIANAIAGTIILSLSAAALAAPVAVGTAIYLQRYATDSWPVRLVRLMIDVLSGTPSIILGILGLLFFVFYLKPITGGYSLIAGIVALAILVMPVIERATEEAIRTVPAYLEEGSYALGASLWETIRRITIPFALSGIVTGVILAIGRAAEESAIVYLTAGYSMFMPELSIIKDNSMLLGFKILPLNDKIGTLPINIYYAYSSPNSSIASAFAAALVLILIVMVINAVARVVLWRFKMGSARKFTFPIAITAGGKKMNKDSFIKALIPINNTIATNIPNTSDENKIITQSFQLRDKSTTERQEVKFNQGTISASKPESENVIMEIPNGSVENKKLDNFVKWFLTDPKKDTTKKNEIHDQPITNENPGLRTKPQETGKPSQATASLEIIPASIKHKKTQSHENIEVIPPSNGPQMVGTETEPDTNLIIYKPQSLPSMREVIEKKEPSAIKAEAQPAPAATSAQSQEQTLGLETAVSPQAMSRGVVDAEAEQNVVIYSPQSPPSMKEVSETLSPKGKKGGKAGGLVKWLTTDPKKEAAKVKSTEAMGATVGKGIDKLYATDGSPVKTKTSKSPVKLPKILGGGSSKQKNGNEMPEFNVGKLAQPSLEGSIKDTDFTYAIDPPFQYVRVFFDGEELVYNVLEPVLDDAQRRFMSTIERGLEKLISSKIVAIKPEEREQFLREKFDEIIDMYGWNLNEAYRDRMFYYLRKRYLGYDRIDVIMKDHYIEDISCNGPNAYVYIFHRIYGSVRTNVSYGDVELNKFVMRMAQISGRHISILQPIKDISLPDGSRANLTLGTEVTKKGATFTIRKFKDRPISPIELMEYSSIDARALAYLWTLLDYKRSILVSGGTASGKTTLMNVLCAFIRPELKIVSLEDTPELNLVHPNWIQSVTRSGFGAESSGGTESVSGVSGISAKSPGNIGLYDLLVAALRQRPEYIIVGEVRGAEAFTLFQAIAVGHAAMGTIHAGNMRELLSRVESNPMNVPRTLFAAMDVVCFSAMVRRGDRNVRRVMQIVEILELDTEGNLITNPVFRWDAVSDRFIFTGKSHIFDKIEAQLGIRQEALIKEMESRAAFLQNLRQGGIRDYSTVVENIREYELNKLTGSQKS